MKLTIVIEGDKANRTLQKAMAALEEFDVVSASWNDEKVHTGYTHRGGGITGTPAFPINAGDVAGLVDGLTKAVDGVRARGKR